MLQIHLRQHFTPLIKNIGNDSLTSTGRVCPRLHLRMHVVFCEASLTGLAA